MSPPAKSGPPKDQPTPPPQQPAPRWLHTLWIVGLIVTAILLFLPTGGTTSPKSLTYSDWRADVDGGKVKTATIDSSGRVSGKLADGTSYTSRIPTAAPDQGLIADLLSHKVTIKGTTAGTSFWSYFWGFAPFLLLLGVYFWISRRATKQIAGGVMGIGSSKAKIYDEERPTTGFADVAGYEGAKRE